MQDSTSQWQWRLNSKLTEEWIRSSSPITSKVLSCKMCALLTRPACGKPLWGEVLSFPTVPPCGGATTRVTYCSVRVVSHQFSTQARLIMVAWEKRRTSLRVEQCASHKHTLAVARYSTGTVEFIAIHEGTIKRERLETLSTCRCGRIETLALRLWGSRVLGPGSMRPSRSCRAQRRYRSS